MSAAVPPSVSGLLVVVYVASEVGTVMVTVGAVGSSMVVNVAVTVVAMLKLTVQVSVPVQPAPLQPVKVEPGAGAAVRVTAVL